MTEEIDAVVLDGTAVVAVAEATWTDKPMSPRLIDAEELLGDVADASSIG